MRSGSTAVFMAVVMPAISSQIPASDVDREELRRLGSEVGCGRRGRDTHGGHRTSFRPTSIGIDSPSARTPTPFWV